MSQPESTPKMCVCRVDKFVRYSLSTFALTGAATALETLRRATVFPRAKPNLTSGYNAETERARPAKSDAAWRLLKATAHPKCVQVDASLQSPAPEILDYLARHPDAQDTIDGILHWWELDTCIRNWAPKITETVAQLVERGFLEQKSSGDGHVFYRASTQYLATLQPQSPADS